MAEGTILLVLVLVLVLVAVVSCITLVEVVDVEGGGPADVGQSFQPELSM